MIEQSGETVEYDMTLRMSRERMEAGLFWSLLQQEYVPGVEHRAEQIILETISQLPSKEYRAAVRWWLFDLCTTDQNNVHALISVVGRMPWDIIPLKWWIELSGYVLKHGTNVMRDAVSDVISGRRDAGLLDCVNPVNGDGS